MRRIGKRSWSKNVFLFTRPDQFDITMSDCYGTIKPYNPTWYDLVDNDFYEYEPGVYWKEPSKP